MIKKLRDFENFIVSPKRLENLRGGTGPWNYHIWGMCRSCFDDDLDG